MKRVIAGGEATDLHLELLPSVHFQLGGARRTRVDLAAGRADAAAVQVVVAVLPFLQQAVVATTDGGKLQWGKAGRCLRVGW